MGLESPSWNVPSCTLYEPDINGYLGRTRACAATTSKGHWN